MADNEMYRVLVHNDDVTPVDFVRATFQEVFELDHRQAARLTIIVHKRGVAEVARLTKDDALERVERLQSLARRAGYPLTASVSPAVKPAESTPGETVTLDVSRLSDAQFQLVRALVEELSAA